MWTKKISLDFHALSLQPKHNPNFKPTFKTKHNRVDLSLSWVRELNHGLSLYKTHHNKQRSHDGAAITSCSHHSLSPSAFLFYFPFFNLFLFFSSCFSYLQLKLILYFILLFNINFSILVDIMGWFCFSCEKSLICARVYKLGFWPLGHC